MTKAEFWCRVLGWLQLVAGLAFAALIVFLWRLVRDIFMIDDVPALSFLVWIFVALAALPTFLAGLLTIIFANAVEQAGQGLRGQQKIALRLVMALSGLWSAGVIGFAGLSAPPLTILGLFGLASTAIAIMGPDWTSDLLKPTETPA